MKDIIIAVIFLIIVLIYMEAFSVFHILDNKKKKRQARLRKAIEAEKTRLRNK